MSRRTFPIKMPAETVPLIYDFTSDLEEGETVESAVFNILPSESDLDEEVEDMVSGSITTTDTSAVQLITGGTAGRDYETLVVITTSLAREYALDALLPIRSYRPE